MRRLVALLGVLAVVWAPVPAMSADGPTLLPVRDLVADADIGYLWLSWTDPGNADGDGFIVCGQEGTTALAAPTFWCNQPDSIRRETRSMEWFSPAQTWTYSVFARDSNGTLSQAASVTVRGTVTQMSTVPSTDQVTTGIRLVGRLTDGMTGAAMSGQAVDVYATRHVLPGEHTPDGFSSVDVHIERVRTDASGAFQRTYPLRPGWDYQARFHGSGVRMGNLSVLVPADGSSFIELGSRDAASLRSGKRAVTLVAKVPARRAGDRIAFQRMTKRRWTLITTREVSATRTVTLRQRVSRRSTPVYRAVLLQVRRTQQPSVPLRIRRG